MTVCYIWPRLGSDETMKIIHLIAGMAVAFPFTTATFAQGPLVAPAMVTIMGEDTEWPDIDILYSYQIGRFEVGAREYLHFLNAVAASDPYGLYHPDMATNTMIGTPIKRSGEPGSYTYEYNHTNPSSNFFWDTSGDDYWGNFRYSAPVARPRDIPISYVGIYSAMRFCNWLHNGATNGADTETGAYTLNGMTDGILPPRNPGAKYWLPNRKEWFKAAYFNRYTWDLNMYPMDGVYGSHTLDLRTTGINNHAHANYRTGDDRWGAIAYYNGSEMVYSYGYCALRPRGSYYDSLAMSRYIRHGSTKVWAKCINTYGTFDMGGNVAEWTEDGARRGGSFLDNEIAMENSQNDHDHEWRSGQGWGNMSTGFRVASLAGQHTFHVTNGYIDVDLPGEIIAPSGVYIYKPDHEVAIHVDNVSGQSFIDDDRLTAGIPAHERYNIVFPDIGWWRPENGGAPKGPNYSAEFSSDYMLKDGLPASGRYEFYVTTKPNSYPFTNYTLNNYYLTLKTVPAAAPSPIESTALGSNGFTMSWLNKHSYVRIQRSTSLTEGDWETIGTLNAISPIYDGYYSTYSLRSWSQAWTNFTDPAPPPGRAYYRIKVD